MNATSATSSTASTASGSTTTTTGGSTTTGGTTTGSGSTTTGTATLHWAAPTVNVDGSLLTNLAGYHVYYGTSTDALTQIIDVSGAASTTVSVDNLSAGTYYFSVVAYNSAGVESGDSNIASKTI